MDGPQGPDLGGYELLDELGRGGMGRVLRVRHRTTGALRALKVMAGFVDPDALERLRREGAALARVGGDGIVPVHEAGVEKGRAFLVLGLMPGGSLRDRLRARKVLDWREVCGLIATVARALERCHAAGLIHRDLKPDNVLFDDEDRPRLADFGCVRDLGAKTLTATGETLGTLPYMAPEQLEGARPTPKVDVYALGVMLHELVAGRLPFEASASPARLLREKLAPSRPRPRLAGAPAALEALIDRAIATDPAARPDAAALAVELDALREGNHGAARTSRGGLTVAAVALVVSVAAGAAWALAPTDPLDPAPPVVVPSRTTPSAPLVAGPAEKPATIDEAIFSLQSRRPARVAAAIASRALAATPPPTERQRDALKGAALARLEHAALVEEGTAAGDVRAACDDALMAVTIINQTGARLDAHILALVPDLLRRLNRAKGAVFVLDSELFATLTEVLPRWPDSDLARAAGDLCETADRPDAPATAAAVQAALDAAIRLSDEAELHYVRGRLQAHRCLDDGRRDLIDPALADLARARSLGVEKGFSYNLHGFSLVISARLEGLAGRHAEGLALLDGTHPDGVVQALRTDPVTRPLLMLERARLHLNLGNGRAASELLARVAEARGSSLTPIQGALVGLAMRARDTTDPAKLKEIAEAIPDYSF